MLWRGWDKIAIVKYNRHEKVFFVDSMTFTPEEYRFQRCFNVHQIPTMPNWHLILICIECPTHRVS